MEKPNHRDFTYVDTMSAYRSSPVLGETDDLRSDLQMIFYALWSRKLTIVMVTFLCLLAAIIYVRAATPLYTSVTEIFIDPRKKELTGGEVIPSGLGSSALGADTALMESQVAIMVSESVTGGLIRELLLDKDPEFIGNATPSLTDVGVTIIRSIIYGDASAYERSDYEKAKRKLGKRVRIKRVGNTYVVQIQSRAAEPQKAADIANGLAQMYISESRRHSQDSTLTAAYDIDSRLGGLAKAAQFAAQAVEDYRRDNGLIGAQNMLVVEQQLSNINNQLSQAQSEVKNAKSQLDEARVASANPTVANLGVLQSTLSNGLLSSLADLSAQEATLKTSLLSNHPRMLSLREQLRSIEGALQSELRRVLSRYETAYNVAKQNEVALNAQLLALQSEAATSNSDSVRLRELEREATLSRGVYENFLTRSKQVNVEVGLQSDNTRIVSVAYPASRPTHPKAKIVLPAAMAGGLILGLVIAWFFHVFNGTEIPHRRRVKSPLHQNVALGDVQ